MTAEGEGRTKKIKAKKRRSLTARWLAGLVVAGTAYILFTFAQVWWASRADDAQPVDAIVVLGAAQYDGRPSPVLKGRLDHAHELFEQKLADIIILTGGGQEGDRTTEAASGYLYLLEAGVPEPQLLLEVDAGNTWESLLAIELILENRELESIILVSDPYHSRRLQGVSHELGLEAYVSPTDLPATFKRLGRETVAVGIGSVLGYRRLGYF